MFLQHPSNRGPAHSMPKVLQGALNPRVAPGRVLRRHAHDQQPDVCLQTWAPTAATGVRRRAGDQLAIPSENSVRRDDRGYVGQPAASEPVSKGREASPFRITESQRPTAQLRL